MLIETTCFFDKFRTVRDGRLSLDESRRKRNKYLNAEAPCPLQDLQGYHLELLMLEAATHPDVDEVRIHFERNNTNPTCHFCFLCDELAEAGCERLTLLINYQENCLYIPLFTEDEEVELTNR